MKSFATSLSAPALPARPPLSAIAPAAPHRRPLAACFAAWWATLHLDERSAYLAGASDHADLERRIRVFDRRTPTWRA